MLERKTVSQCVSADYCKGWNDAVDAQPKWISVEDRLPEIESEDNTLRNTETVYAVDKNGNPHVGYFRIYKLDSSFEFVGTDLDCFDYGEFDVTHWISLPEPPEEETKC